MQQEKVQKIDIVVIGGGPAGMMAAGRAAAEGCTVVLLEKMEQCGRKLRITGKGRCNLTNTKDWNEFSTHIYPKPDFLRSAFWHFPNTAVMEFFDSIGIETVIERGDRVFPACQDARKVADAMVRWLQNSGVKILCGAEVVLLEPTTAVKHSDVLETVPAREGLHVGFRKQVHSEVHYIEAKAVIIATGGCSYPTTGSTGDGYRLAAQAGHTCTPCFPSLNALMPQEYDTRLQGIALTNVKLSLYVKGEMLQEEFGELSFTNLGIEGPLGLRLSRKAVVALCKKEEVILDLNLKPALTQEQLNNRLKREWVLFGEESLELFLSHYLPRQLIQPFVKAMELRLQDKVFTMTDEHKNKIAKGLHSWKFSIQSYGGFERAVITAGGIPLEEIQKKNLASRKLPGLFFAGEVIDLDGDTGGYNLQIAFSTGALAGSAAAKWFSRYNTF